MDVLLRYLQEHNGISWKRWERAQGFEHCPGPFKCFMKLLGRYMDRHPTPVPNPCPCSEAWWREHHVLGPGCPAIIKGTPWNSRFTETCTEEGCGKKASQTYWSTEARLQGGMVQNIHQALWTKSRTCHWRWPAAVLSHSMTVWHNTIAVIGVSDVVLRTVVITVSVHVVLRGAAVCQWCLSHRMTHGRHLNVCNCGWVTLFVQLLLFV